MILMSSNPYFRQISFLQPFFYSQTRSLLFAKDVAAN